MIKKLFSSRVDEPNFLGVDPATHIKNDQDISSVDPDRFFLIIFLKSGMIYRTWIRKTDIDNFREKFQNSRDTIGIKKRFFQFGRHDEFDLTEIA